MEEERECETRESFELFACFVKFRVFRVLCLTSFSAPHKNQCGQEN
jgi:hypothetical protein